MKSVRMTLVGIFVGYETRKRLMVVPCDVFVVASVLVAGTW